MATDKEPQDPHFSSAAPLDCEQSVEQVIRVRAYAIYEERGTSEGSAVDNWLLAEAEVTSQRSSRDS